MHAKYSSPSPPPLQVHLHSSVQHENIITMHAAFQEGDKVVMVQEYADGADLFTVLHKYGGRLSERLAVQLVLDPFMRVLHYLHTKGIIHRDIKVGRGSAPPSKRCFSSMVSPTLSHRCSA